MSERIIQQADLHGIERNLSVLHSSVEVVNSNVRMMDGNVKIINDEVGKLAREFHEFIDIQNRANRLGQAETRLVQIRQELDKKYGHYDIIRRTATGILQADDLGIVKQATISDAAEELMISTPNYWLAPCLVALAAWINDQPELAERALREGLKRDDEKTSLFFALICRRADRKAASLKWTQRYLANQDEENLDRKTIVILDAYAGGLLGSDSEGVVSQQMETWLSHLESKAGFTEQQTKQWSESISLKRKPVDSNSYTYLKKYSKTWPVLQDIMEGACLHAEILKYFTGIFEKTSSMDAVKVQLDEILNHLVTDFDDEELPLRKQEKFEQFVVDFGGDEARAKQNMQIEQSAFETHKDFTQLLTDAAMKPETTHSSVSTQKFAIALSKDWITDAYNDIIAQNRMKIPHNISINIDTFNDQTTDGQDEARLVSAFEALVEREKQAAMSQCTLTAFEKFCLYGGGAIAGIGVFMLVLGSVGMGLIAAIAGAGMIINHFSKKKQVENQIQNLEQQFSKKREDGTQILRALLAEIVDFRSEFAQKDGESQQVLDFLEQISPEQYMRKLSAGTRRIRI